MTVKVIDTSAVAALLFAEPEAEAMAERFIPAGRKIDSSVSGRSAGISLILRAAATPTLRAYQSALTPIGITGGHLVAPTLLAFELANVCLVKSRRNPDQLPALIEAYRLRDRLGVEEMSVDHAAVVGLAAETGLTAYEASYLWLARSLGAVLITLDRRLERIALAAG